MSPSILPPITGEFPVDFSRRTVLDLSQAVRPVRFGTRSHAVAAQAREASDLFVLDRLRDAPAAPPVERDCDHESVILDGPMITNVMHTGGFAVRQRRTVDLEAPAELAIAAEPEPFQMIANTTQSDAAALLQRLADRRPSARRGHRLPAKRIVAPRTASPVWLAAVIVLGALTAAVLLSGVLVNR
jgi:hypothetical protein